MRTGRALWASLVLASCTTPVLAAPAAPEVEGTELDCERLDGEHEGRWPPDELVRTLGRLEGCIELASRSSDRPRELSRLLRSAELRRLLGSAPESHRDGRRALAIAQELGDVSAEIHAWTRVGEAAFHLADHPFEALAAFERARALASDEPGIDARQRARTMVNVGLAQASLGRRDLAMIELERALLVHPGWRDDALGVTILGNLGTIYHRLGAPAAARRSLERALELARARGRENEVADVVGRMAHHELRRGRPRVAADLFDRALAAARLSPQAAELFLAEGAAEAYRRTGRLREAEELMREVVAVRRRRGSAPTPLCTSILMLGWVREAYDLDLAYETYLEAAALAGVDASCGWPRLDDLARVEAARGELDRAIEHLAGALEVLEGERPRRLSWHSTNWVARGLEPVSRTLIRLLVEHGSDPEQDRERAFDLLERSRASSLVTGIAVAGGAANAHRLPEVQARRMAVLEEEIRELRRRRLAAAGAVENEAAAAEAELARLEAELDEHLRIARRSSRVRPPPAAVDLDAARRMLAGGVLYAAFQVDDAGTLVFVVDESGLSVHQLPVAKAELAARVGGFLDLLAQPDHDGWRAVGAGLFRELVAPWYHRLDSRDRRDSPPTLLVSPDGPLHSLPFAALTVEGSGGRLLLDDAVLALVPSLTALRELRRRGGNGEHRALVVGDPMGDGNAALSTPERRWMRALFEEDGHRLDPVPFGRREAARIARLAGNRAELLVGDGATESVLKGLEPDRYALVHLATHGLLSLLDLDRSALVLAPDPELVEDGFLQAREIELLDLRAELVVLAACRTARGRPLAGEGVRSLAHSFLHAGARTVAGTLWNVYDWASMQLMSLFYEQLAAGASKAEALRRAQLEARARGAPPADWAGYVLLGEPDGAVNLLEQARDRRRRATLLICALAVLAVVALASLLLRRLRRTKRPIR